MRKMIYTGIATAAVIGVSVGAAALASIKPNNNVVSPEFSSVETTSITSETDLFDITTVLENTTTTANTSESEAKTSAAATTKATAAPEPKTIKVNVESKNDLGTLTITDVKINYEFNSIQIGYHLLANIDKVPILSLADTFCTDKSGNKLKCGGTLGDIPDKYIYAPEDTKKVKPVGYESTMSMAFYKFTNASDLSELTLTYKFGEMTPATVTIQVPGIQ